MSEQPNQRRPMHPRTMAVIVTMLRNALEALPVNPEATAEDLADRQEAAEQALAELNPSTPVQAMLASRILSLHYTIAECLRRAMLPDLPHIQVTRYLSSVGRLSRQADTTMEELRRLQLAVRVLAAAAQPKAAAPQAAAATNAPRHPMPSGATTQPQAQPAAAAQNVPRHPMPSGAMTQPQAQPAATAQNVPRHPMPSGAATQPPRSAIEMPPPPPHQGEVWIAEEMARRRAAAGSEGVRAPQ